RSFGGGSHLGQMRYSRCSRNLHQNADRMAYSFKESPAHDRFVDESKQAAPEYQKMARKITAVYCRDVKRKQRLQCLSFVPVVKVATMAFQSFHRGERIRGSVDQLPG